MIEGFTANIREINKAIGWQLPTDDQDAEWSDPRAPGILPDAPASLAIGTTRIEIQQVKDNQITSARFWQASRTTRT